MPSPRLLAVVALVAACGGKSPPAPQAALSSRWSAPAILAPVPADSPYVLALVDPLSEALRARIMARFDSQLAKSMQKFEGLGGGDRSKLEPWVRALLALGDELRGSKASQWFDKLGLD